MLGQCEARDDRRPQRDRRDGAALFFQQDAQRRDAQARPARVLGQCDAEQPGVPELAPQDVVNTRLGALYGADPVLGGVVGEDLLGQVPDRFQFLAKGEVHQASFFGSAGRKTGSDKSGSGSIQSTTTGMPISTSAGAIPVMFAISRVPSASSITATISG